MIALIILGVHAFGFVLALGVWWHWEETRGRTGAEWFWACILWELFLSAARLSRPRGGS